MTLLRFVRTRPVRMLDGGDGCWLWIGGTGGHKPGTKAKYGRLRVDGVSHYAHRYAYELEHGPLPAGFTLIRNTEVCEHEMCCNPSHWLPVDRQRKQTVLSKLGRVSNGVVHSAAITVGARKSAKKLDMEKARQIRYSAVPAKEEAEKYGVDQSMVHKIRRGESWAEATPFSGLVR